MSSIFDLFKSIEKKAQPAPLTHIICGLGNIGAEYENTRHNAGFMAIDYIADKLSLKIDRAKFHALVGETCINDVRVLLMKPVTYMNNSGIAIKEAADFYKIPAANILILHDEINFEPGIVRIRRKGSAGGHNGLKSIIASIGEDFPRIKIGVGKKPPEYDLVNWVLGRFPREDLLKLADIYENIFDASKLIISGKIDDAMCKYSK